MYAQCVLASGRGYRIDHRASSTHPGQRTPAWLGYTSRKVRTSHRPGLHAAPLALHTEHARCIAHRSSEHGPRMCPQSQRRQTRDLRCLSSRTTLESLSWRSSCHRLAPSARPLWSPHRVTTPTHTRLRHEAHLSWCAPTARSVRAVDQRELPGFSKASTVHSPRRLRSRACPRSSAGGPRRSSWRGRAAQRK